MWPTATTEKGLYNKAGLSTKSGDGLATAAKQWATPAARDWRSGKASGETMERNARPLNEQVVSGPTTNSLGGGALAPEFAEWVMGFPPGWTET